MDFWQEKKKKGVPFPEQIYYLLQSVLQSPCLLVCLVWGFIFGFVVLVHTMSAHIKNYKTPEEKKCKGNTSRLKDVPQVKMIRQGF